MDYKKIAKQVLEYVGGAENINSVWHCATRLRFKIKNTELIQMGKLKSIEDVVAVVTSGGQLQIVIGNEVDQVFEALQSFKSMENISETEVDSSDDKTSVVNQIIIFISGTFSPFLGAMAGTGILKGFLALAVTLHWMSPDSGTYLILYAAGDALFYFLPMLLAVTAAKHLKTNPYTAMALAGALLYPNLILQMKESDTLNFMNIPIISANYGSSVIPILVTVWIMSYLERFLNHIIPVAIKSIFTPLISLVIMVPLTLMTVGPFGSWIGMALSNVILWANTHVPYIAGAILGAGWQIFVIFGVHWTFVPIMANNIGELGQDPLTPIICVSVMAQAGAALGVFLKIKDIKMKSLAGSGTITSLLGITEPTIYGVTLKLKRPFMIAVGSGAIGGAIVAGGGVTAKAFTLPSLLALPVYLGNGFQQLILGLSIAFVLSTTCTYLWGLTGSEVDQPVKIGQEIIQRPVDGKLISLSQVPDEVFASGAMGSGIGIIPDNNIIKAPLDGVISVVYPHAIGITSNHEAEILIHVGINTVSLKGECFKTQVKLGNRVKLGDPLLNFDREKIEAKGFNPIVILIVTNSPQYKIKVVSPITADKNKWLLKLQAN